MANDYCCGCTMEADYGTSTVSGVGSLEDPFKVSLIDPSFRRPVAQVTGTGFGYDQTVLNNTPTAVNFDADGVLLDTDGMWVSGTPTRLTINTAGLYLMGGCVSWTGNVTGTRELSFRMNGTTEIESQDVRPSSAAAQLVQSLSYLWFFQQGDYVELVARQESGTSLTLFGNLDYSPMFWMIFVGKKV